MLNLRYVSNLLRYTDYVEFLITSIFINKIVKLYSCWNQN